MRKFIKIVAILSFVFILAGIGVASAAVVMGANIGTLRHALEERHLLSYGDVQWESDYWHAEYENLTELQIRQKGGTVLAEASDEVQNFSLDGHGGGLENVEYYEDEQGNRLILTVRAGEEYNLQIPAQWNLRKFKAEVRDGEFYGEGIQAETAEIQSDGGSVDLIQEDGKKLSLFCEEGSLFWKGGGIPEISADCRDGEMELVFSEETSLDSYSYRLRCREGSIDVPNLHLEGEEQKEFEAKPEDGSEKGMLEAEARDGGSIWIEQEGM